VRLSALPGFGFLAACCLLGSGCAVLEEMEKNQAAARAERANAALRSAARTEHAAYRDLAGWKKQTYRNKALLEQATPDNVSIEISLAEQRGLLLINGAIAMDFPVATGRKSHPTPVGSYTIRAKEREYYSNLYGRITDAAGAVVVADADSRKDAVPEGGAFAGSSMPYWMRLTDTGVGMHVGYVPGGRTASHGCIRLKKDTAAELFERTKIGTPVVVAENFAALQGE
jgi:lipoprotein-anchoring transpeptidase ErfK/SrfK